MPLNECNSTKNQERQEEEFCQEVQDIAVIVCYLTKFVVARPLRTKTSNEIGLFTGDLPHFWVPKILQHDQGPEFSSKVNQ